MDLDHREAVLKGYTEKYLLNELDEEQRSAFEEHFFSCPACAEDLKTTVEFLDNAGEVLREQSARRVSFGMNKSRLEGWLSLFWPMPAGACCAFVFVVGAVFYLAMGVVPGLQDRLEISSHPQVVPWNFLPVSRSETKVVKVSVHHRMVGLTLSVNVTQSYLYYQVAVGNENQETIMSTVVVAPAPGEEMHLMLPVDRMKSGRHTVVLSGMNVMNGPVVAPDFARYYFMLEKD